MLGVGADVCIYGFGTNCVRQPEDDLTGYLRDTKTVFDRLDRAGVRTISLLSPWFDEGYCGKAGQARLRRWNGALAGLCLERGVTMLDTYGAFCREPRRWFSETATPMRHYNADACRVIAEMALAALGPILE